jgi:prepilin-type N-terminal cleavage/methylation domain-containing protein
MKTEFPITKRVRGFTLPEILVAVSVFILLVGGIVAANLFGLSMFRITATTLDVTDDTRKMMGKMVNEVQTCKSTKIGDVRAGLFVAVLDGQVQQGTGLLIYPGLNTNNFIIYFLNPADKTFRRTTSTPGSAVILADSITNTVVFSARDLSGNILTNNQHNRVIHLNLEFYHAKQFRQIADYYKFETSVTRRALE